MFRKNTTRRASDAMVPGEGRDEVLSVKVRGGGREKGGKWVGGRDRREEWGRGWHYQKWHTLLTAHIRLDRVNGNGRLPFTLTLEHHPLILSDNRLPLSTLSLFNALQNGKGGVRRTASNSTASQKWWVPLQSSEECCERGSFYVAPIQPSYNFYNNNDTKLFPFSQATPMMKIRRIPENPQGSKRDDPCSMMTSLKNHAGII